MKVIKLEDVLDFLELNDIEKKETRKPPHGSCCTCQECGYDYDDCVCKHNETIDWLNNVVFEIDESPLKSANKRRAYGRVCRWW